MMNPIVKKYYEDNGYEGFYEAAWSCGEKILVARRTTDHGWTDSLVRDRSGGYLWLDKGGRNSNKLWLTEEEMLRRIKLLVFS